MSTRDHWEGIYDSRRPDEVSWYQERATLSLEIITATVADRDTPILDVGGGASTLVDGLLDLGYRKITVLDFSASALGRVHERLGDQAPRVSLIQGDVTTMRLRPGSVALWHDRAVFHFLTDPGDRGQYLAQVRHCVTPGGWVLMATFAEDGPERCSGLLVQRYSPEQLHATLGDDFELIESRREEHVTPSGSVQAFTYCLCRYRPVAEAQPAA